MGKVILIMWLELDEYYGDRKESTSTRKAESINKIAMLFQKRPIASKLCDI